jgi:hypothetical protein
MYKHQVIQHNIGEYVFGSVPTNTIEGFGSLMKKRYLMDIPLHIKKALVKVRRRACIQVQHTQRNGNGTFQLPDGEL